MPVGYAGASLQLCEIVCKRLQRSTQHLQAVALVSGAWKADALPTELHPRVISKRPAPSNGHGGGRIRTYVGVRRQIYSLLPLATRAPHPMPAVRLTPLSKQHPGANRSPGVHGVFSGRNHPAMRPGADEGTRTPNLLITTQLLYQLSYVSRAMRSAIVYSDNQVMIPSQRP